MAKEGEPQPQEGQSAPLGPFELPGELAEFLRRQEYTMVSQATDQGTVFVVKAPARELTHMRGDIPIGVTHELHQHPLAPVIRTVVHLVDQPDRPLALETFFNVADPDQRTDYARLAEQEELLFLLYDERLSHRLTKQVANTASKEMSEILTWADRFRAAIPEDAYNFDRAKAQVMANTSL